MAEEPNLISLAPTEAVRKLSQHAHINKMEGDVCLGIIKVGDTEVLAYSDQEAKDEAGKHVCLVEEMKARWVGYISKVEAMAFMRKYSQNPQSVNNSLSSLVFQNGQPSSKLSIGSDGSPVGTSSLAPGLERLNEKVGSSTISGTSAGQDNDSPVGRGSGLNGYFDGVRGEIVISGFVCYGAPSGLASKCIPAPPTKIYCRETTSGKTVSGWSRDGSYKISIPSQIGRKICVADGQSSSFLVFHIDATGKITRERRFGPPGPNDGCFYSYTPSQSSLRLERLFSRWLESGQ